MRAGDFANRHLVKKSLAMPSQMFVNEKTGSLVVRLLCTADVSQPSGVPPSHPPVVGEVEKLKMPKSLKMPEQNQAGVWNVTAVWCSKKLKQSS